jgi:hypothetical protein
MYQENNEKSIKGILEQNPNDIEKFVQGEKLPIVIKTNTLFDLITAFEMIPCPTNSLIQKSLAIDIISFIIPKILNKSYSDEEINHGLKSSFLKILANFLLKSSPEDAGIYLDIVLKEFKLCKKFITLLTEIIYVQDRNEEYYDNFWNIWKALRSKIIEISKNNSNSNVSALIKVYLLTNVRSGETNWHSLTNQNKRFIRKLTEDINQPSTVLYSISKLLTDIGSEFLNDGVEWIANLIKKNSELSNITLEVNTIYYLEKVIKKYISLERSNIRKYLSNKENVLIILNFMVDKGSTSAYMLRENIL